MEPKSERIALKTGLSYHVLSWNGPPESDHTVVLIHGFLDLAWGWRRTAEKLAEHFHVIAPDMRGHGDSDRVGAGGYYYFADYLADLDDVLGRLGAKRLSLVGHSMGGAIASYYAATFPERIFRLALLEGLGPPESTTIGPDRMREFIASWRKVVDRSPRFEASLGDAARRLRKHDRLLDAGLALELAERGTIKEERGYRFKHDPLHYGIGPYGFETAIAQRFWHAVRCPVLLVDGAESEFVKLLSPAELERRMSSFATARRAILPNAGHMIQRHQPDALAALLRDFLSQDLVP